jgi:hypothetical protein
MDFVISPIGPTRLEAMRRGRIDDAGEPFEVFDAGTDGAPLRCCLREARSGDRLALIAYRPEGTSGAYRELGPVFVHGGACAGYPDKHSYPAGFLQRSQILRAYGEDGRIVGGLVVEGADAETGIRQLFARPDVAFLHSRNVIYGCYMFAIHRVSSDSSSDGPSGGPAGGSVGAIGSRT